MKAAKLRTKNVTLSDRISNLPDDLLLKILSLVPINDAVNTTLLSKRWKSLWKMTQTLEYDIISCSKNIGSLGFNKFYERSLQLHESPLLKTLTLKLGQKYLELPDSFLNTVCFRSLKSLHLKHVSFHGQESLCRLISACPVLEDLLLDNVICCVKFHSPSSFTISVPSLQRLEIKDNPTKVLSYPSYYSRFKINTPSLKYLWIKSSTARFDFYEDMPNLMEARLGVDPNETEKFLRFLTSVQFLLIHIPAAKVLLLADKISQRLRHLELHIYGNIPRSHLLHLLKHSPKLQFLKLREKYMTKTWPIIGSRFRFHGPLPSVCNPSSVPECVSFHLETFQWRGYKGRKEELEIVFYILHNARCLKTADIYVSASGRPGGEKELLLIEELESMPLASTSCHLVTRHS